jgi:hypothetical protein
MWFSEKIFRRRDAGMHHGLNEPITPLWTPPDDFVFPANVLLADPDSL